MRSTLLLNCNCFRENRQALGDEMTKLIVAVSKVFFCQQFKK